MILVSLPFLPRRKAVWTSRRAVSAVLSSALVVAFAANALAHDSHRQDGPHARPGAPGSQVKAYRLDQELQHRSTRGNPLEVTSVIVTLVPNAPLPANFRRFARGEKLDIVNGQVLELPNGLLKQLAAQPEVESVHFNRPVEAHNYRTSVTVGATTVHQNLGLTGAGVGVAIIDSGIATWHDDLTVGSLTALYPYGNQRVKKFVDFVNKQSLPYDDNGHGSHVGGIVAGNGYDSKGEKAGIAPGASLVSLKVLDANGQGSIGNVIAALNWLSTNAKTYNVRVVNLSVGAGIFESYWTDPLTLATKHLVDQGITVVAAAGNLGKNGAGQLQYGGITAPGNAPWVLTVGASSTNGTLTRNDDTMADYSSAGPTKIDFVAKPDLVAPGTGTISLAVPGSTFYTTKAQYLVSGKVQTAGMPYLALSGTSMAAPVVSGTVALMLQANPKLTPNLIKAILQYTAQQYPGYNALRQGAGFLNTLGAVKLAQFYATARAGDQVPVQKVWSRQIIWGNHRLTGGIMVPTANAWATNIVWGTAKTMMTTGDNIVWGTLVDDNIVWGTSLDNIVWGTSLDNIVWGTSGDIDNIVWGTQSGDDNIVWGTDCGGADCDNIVWGTVDVDNIVWGTLSGDDNIVWGTSGLDLDNIVWGTSAEAATVIYPESSTEPLPDVIEEFGDVVSIGSF